MNNNTCTCTIRRQRDRDGEQGIRQHLAPGRHPWVLPGEDTGRCTYWNLAPIIMFGGHHYGLWAFWKRWWKGFSSSLQFCTNKPGFQAKCYAPGNTICKVRAEPKKEKPWQYKDDNKLGSPCHVAVQAMETWLTDFGHTFKSRFLSFLLEALTCWAVRFLGPKVEMTLDTVLIWANFSSTLLAYLPISSFLKGKVVPNEFHFCLVRPEGTELLFSFSPGLWSSQP